MQKRYGLPRNKLPWSAMSDHRSFLAIIPARSGSRGVQDKNIRILGGVPLIAHTIRAALASGIFNQIIVSTDSPKIGEISRSFGARIPFMRPEELATDTAGMAAVILHALDFFAEDGTRFDAFTLLQPTSPLRTGDDIREARDLFLAKGANAVVSVCETDHPPAWCNTLPPDLSMDGFLGAGMRDTRRQDLPVYYRVNGALYLAGCDYYRKYRDWFREGSYAFVMPRERSIDIDTPYDLKLCECLMKGGPDGT